jgi:monoglucosyldiacylglycerol epimerase
VTGAAGRTLVWLAEVAGLFLAGTVVFDAVHFSLHRCAGAGAPWLRRIGGLHQTHHDWFDRALRHDPALQAANLRRHVVPEYATHAAVSLLLLPWLPAVVVLPVLGLQTLVFALIVRTRGLDVNHRPRDRVRAARPLWFCLPDYHLLHHVHPDAHFSSWIKAFDQLAGTGLALAGRRVVVRGDAAAWGAALARDAVASVAALPDPGADPAARERALDAADVLVLEGARAADAPRVERLLARARDRLEPVELWACDPAPDWTPWARTLWADPRVLYRHVPGARARGAALFFLRRGFHYAPATPRAALAFPRFRWRLRLSASPA